jgi:hypothetical protein
MSAQVVKSAPRIGMSGAPAAAPAIAPTRHRPTTGDAGFASSSSHGPAAEAPTALRDAFISPGKPLDPATKASMESRFGVDLAAVRVHTGAEAIAAARSVNAHAYTIGQDIFFGEGQYDSRSREGLRLLAHELSHTVQQAGGSAGKRLSRAPRGVYRDPIPGAKATGEDAKKGQTDQVSVPVPWPLLEHLELTPPSLLAPPRQRSIFSPGRLTLGGSTPDVAGATPSPYSSPFGYGSARGQSGASLFQTPSSYSPTSPSIFPPLAHYSPSPLAPAGQPNPALLPPGGGAGAATTATAPKAPDRVSLVDLGSLSIGARFGFPDLSKDSKTDGPPSALQESLRKGEVLNYFFTGQPPSEYSVDPGKLVGALWGIFSTQIAPDVARKIAAGLSSKPAGGGVSYQLDATLLLKFGSGSGPTASKTGGGGGATLTITF